MTREALKLLNWVKRREPTTKAKIVYDSNSHERWIRRMALDELVSSGYVVRDAVGWYRTADGPSIKGLTSHEVR